MSRASRFTTACLASALSPWLLAAASTAPAAADETFKPTTIISLPDGQSLRAFDISFVDPASHTYALAVSATKPNPAPGPNTANPCAGNAGCGPATNPRVVLVDTRSNVVTAEYNANFAGNCSISPSRDTYSGPDGVMIIERGRNADIWVADGPKFNTNCDPTSGVAVHSSVKVLDLHTGALKKTIDLGGIRRSDELCYNPNSDVVLVANDDPLDNFIAFIAEDSYQVLQKIRFDGTDPNGNKILANGIEQCVFDPRDGKFYLNIPNTGAASLSPPGPGVVVRISGHAPFHVEAVFDVGADVPSCGGAAGLAVGPDHQLGLACGGTDALIIDDRTGNTIKLLTGIGGGDEVWYNPGNNHYFFGIAGTGQLGVADAGPPPSLDPTVKSAVGAHSVAADPFRNQTYVPIGANALDAPPPPVVHSALCSSTNDVFGNPGSSTMGCIAIFTAPNDKDDCIAEGMPVVAVNEGGDAEFRRGRCRDHD